MKKIQTNKNVVTAIIVLIAVLSIVMTLLFKKYTLRYVVSDSMKYTIPRGSVVVIKKCNIDSINENDIICYKSYGADVIHRVTEVHTDESLGTVLHTKGDSNKTPDIIDITSEMFIGKVIESHVFSTIQLIISTTIIEAIAYIVFKCLKEK